MILYDNKSFRSLCKLRGSIFPRALLIALIPTSLAAILKGLEQGGQVELNLDLVTDGAVYGSFAFVLGFTLVFRCQQAYQRYFASAKALHMMSSEWLDAVGSLLSFVKVSKKSHREKHQFEAVLVRLFCLLHAIAMEELCCLAEENFHLLDVEAFAKEDLMVLHRNIQGPQKVQVVLVWIKYFIVQGIQKGLLTIPPPILTRVYQEIGAGMAEFHDAQLISMWPFPFPYAQLSLFLTLIHLCVAPLIMVQYSKTVWSAVILTLVSVVSVLALNIISVELENPFGEDPNDLPANEVHDHYRDSLLVLADPDNWQVPRLLRNATLEFGHLKKRRDSQRNTISEFLRDPSRAAEQVEVHFAEEEDEQAEHQHAQHQVQAVHVEHLHHGQPGHAEHQVLRGQPGHAEHEHLHHGHGGQQERQERKAEEETLQRLASLLENFLVKQTEILEARLPKLGKAPSVFAAPLEQQLCGCSLKR